MTHLLKEFHQLKTSMAASSFHTIQPIRIIAAFTRLKLMNMMSPCEHEKQLDQKRTFETFGLKRTDRLSLILAETSWDLQER